MMFRIKGSNQTLDCRKRVKIDCEKRAFVPIFNILKYCNSLKIMARQAGLEPATYCLEGIWLAILMIYCNSLIFNVNLYGC